ncbi:MAG: hypothetical protein AAF270_13410 [Pseudomonadota bacterium]
MTLRTSRAMLIALGAGLSTSASAHVGDHGENGLMAALGHLFTEPTHLAFLAAAIIGGIGVGIYTRNRLMRSKRAQLDKLRTR